MPDAWTIKGDLVLSCNCTVFCPCVLSLGQHPPTEGYCQTWAGIQIEEGQSGVTDLSGLKVGLIADIPRPCSSTRTPRSRRCGRSPAFSPAALAAPPVC